MKKLLLIITISILLLSSCATTAPSEEVATLDFIPVGQVQEVAAPAEENVEIIETITEEPVVVETIEEAPEEELPLAQVEEETEEEIIEILVLDKDYIRFNYPSNLSLEYSPEENEKLYLAELNEVPPSEFDYISIKTYLASNVISNTLFETQLNELSAVEIRDLVEVQRAKLAQNPSYLSLISYELVKISNLSAVYYVYELSEDGQRVIIENYYIQNEDVIHEIIISYRAEKANLWRENANYVLSSIEFLYPIVVEEVVVNEPVVEIAKETPMVEKDEEIIVETLPVRGPVSEDPKPSNAQGAATKVSSPAAAIAEEEISIFNKENISIAIGALVLLFGIIFLIARLKKSKKNKKDNVNLD